MMTHKTINTLTEAITEVTHTLTKTEIKAITDKIPAKFTSRKEVIDCYIDYLKSFLTQLVEYLGTDGYVRLKHNGTHKEDENEFGPLVQANPELVNMLVDKLNDFYYHKVMDIKYTDDTKEMILNDAMAHHRMNSYSFQIVVFVNNELIVLFDDALTMLRTQNTPRWDINNDKYCIDLIDTFTFQQGFINLSSITKEITEMHLDSYSSEQDAATWVSKHNQVAILIDTFNIQVATLKQRMLKSALEKFKPTELTTADNDKMHELVESEPFKNYIFINPEHLFSVYVITKRKLLNKEYKPIYANNFEEYEDTFEIKQTFKINNINLFVGNLHNDDNKPYADAVLMPITKQLLIPGWLGEDVKSENYDSNK